MSWDDVSFVIAGKTRKRVIMEMGSCGNPTMLAKTLEIHVANISRILLELQNRNLVKCITPEKKVGRIYEVTKTGKEVIIKINEMK